MKKILFILQNAYKSDKYRFRNKHEWYKELMRSHSGRRLSEMIPDNAEIFVINSSRNIGESAKSCFPADIKHIKRFVSKVNPDIICCCGKVAEQGCIKLGLNFLSAPHPAWRQLSKADTLRIRNTLEDWRSG